MTHPFARPAPGDIADLGLSRAELTALAMMPAGQIARMDGMARLSGCGPARLASDHDLSIAAALTCMACTEQLRCRTAVDAGVPLDGSAFCPNAGIYRMLVAG